VRLEASLEPAARRPRPRSPPAQDAAALPQKNQNQKPNPKKQTVIENEFGEIDIDSELVARTETLNSDGEPDGAAAITVLSNGCLCCSVRGDLIAALNALWERRSEFDHIVIETTGLANPAPVIQSMYLDEDLPHRVRLDGVVTVVDAANAWRHLSGRQGAEQEGGAGAGGTGVADFDAPINEAVEQVAYADRIVLNKVDLAGAEGKAAAQAAQRGGLDALEARLRSVNELASVVRAVRGEVDVDYVLGVGGFDLGKVEEEVVRVANPAHGEPGHVCGGGDCGHDHDHHEHDHGHSHAHAHAHDHHEHGHSHAHAESNPAHGEPGHVCGGGDCGHDHSHDHHDHDHAHSHHSHSHDHSTPSPASVAPPSLAFRGARSAARITAAKHDDRVSSLSISVEGEMDLEKVNYTMGALLEARSEDLFRMKGILAIQGMEQRYVFQAVHALFEGQPDREWREGEARVSRMVLIGRELDADAFREAFERCLVTEGGDRPSEAVKARVAEEAAGKA
jgi:G3E family GTPase